MSDAEGEQVCPLENVSVAPSVGGGFSSSFLGIHVRNRLDVRNANEMRRKDKTELCRIGTLLECAASSKQRTTFFKPCRGTMALEEPAHKPRVESLLASP